MTLSKFLSKEQADLIIEGLKECHEVALNYRRKIGDEDSIILEQNLRKMGDIFDLGLHPLIDEAD